MEIQKAFAINQFEKQDLTPLIQLYNKKSSNSKDAATNETQVMFINFTLLNIFQFKDLFHILALFASAAIVFELVC